MANKERGEFTLVAGDRTFKLRLTTNACAEMEDISGGRTWDQVQLGLARGSVKDVRLLFWGSLREYHPEIATDHVTSLRAVGKLLDDAGGFEGVLIQMRAFMALNREPVEPAPAQKGPEKPLADPPDAQAETVGADSVSTLA